MFKAMYARSIESLPQPTPELRAKLSKNATARQAMAADFNAMYGQMTETINRVTVSHTSVTEEQVSQMLAATIPAVVTALGKVSAHANEMGFGRQLRNLNT